MKAKNGFLKTQSLFFFPKVVSRCLAASLASMARVLCLNFLYTMVSEVFLTSQSGTDIFPAVVFGAVAWGPVGCFEGWTGAVQGTDQSPTGLHCSLRVFANGLLSRLCSTTLILELKLAFCLLLLLLLLLPLTRPIGGAHELFALLLGLPVAFLQLLLLTSHDEPKWLQLVVHVVISGWSDVPLALFSPFARPPDAHDDAEEAEQAEDRTQ